VDFDNLIVAALATCMIIIVFATGVTFLQQFFFKILQSRRIGMIRLLDKLYTGAVLPRLKAAEIKCGPDKTFWERRGPRQKFALAMTVNTTFKPLAMFRPFRNVWLLRRYFGGRLQRMSTRQFVEHLAGTDAGEAFKATFEGDDEALKRTLHDLAYEFERYGEEQWRSFRTNTTMLTVILGIALAFAFNVDIWRTFNILAANPSKAEQVSNALASNIRQTESALASLSDAEKFVDAGDQAPSEAEKQAALEKIRRSLSAATTSLKDGANSSDSPEGGMLDFGLPMGAGIYPFCFEPQARADFAPPPQPAASETAATPPRFSDPRCNDTTVGINPIEFVPFMGSKGNDPLGTLIGRIGDPSGPGLWWLLSVLFTGGLFGLGAPFWFDVFNQLAAMANRRGIAQLTPDRSAQLSQAGQGGQPGSDAGDANSRTSAWSPRPLAVRESLCATPDELFDAFMMASRSRNEQDEKPAGSGGIGMG
jgi:hypothetical protein